VTKVSVIFKIFKIFSKPNLERGDVVIFGPKFSKRALWKRFKVGFFEQKKLFFATKSRARGGEGIFFWF